jgi:hypothetical protein
VYTRISKQPSCQPDESKLTPNRGAGSVQTQNKQRSPINSDGTEQILNLNTFKMFEAMGLKIIALKSP